MNGRVSGLAKKILSRYGKPKFKLGETYEIDGKVYVVTDGNLEDLDEKIVEIIKDVNK